MLQFNLSSQSVNVYQSETVCTLMSKVKHNCLISQASAPLLEDLHHTSKQLRLCSMYILHCVPEKVSPLNILQQPPQTCTDLNEILHKTASIFVIDVKFHKNLLFRLRDVHFAVTNLSYRYNLLLADVICGDRCDVSAC